MSSPHVTRNRLAALAVAAHFPLAVTSQGAPVAAGSD